MKFVAIMFAPQEEIQKYMTTSTPEAQKSDMAEWKMWDEKHKASFVDAGAPLGKTKRVSKSGIADAKNEITAYAIVEAASHEAAAQLFIDSPHLAIPGATIDVMTWVDMSEWEKKNA